MAEKLEVYSLEGKPLGEENREKFYEDVKNEFAKKGKVSRKIKSIRLLLMNSKGRIYLQKRSNLKEDNPGLYDKTIGGHVKSGDSYTMTVIRECAEELGFPASILSEEEFQKAIRITDLSIVGLFRKVDYMDDFKSIRMNKKNEKFVQPYMCEFYVGYYDGSIRFVDGESSGMEVYSLVELKKDILQNPGKYTEDIKFMMKKYEKYLKPAK